MNPRDVGAELARRSRREQGLPPTITDPAAIATVAELMNIERRGAPSKEERSNAA